MKLYNSDHCRRHAKRIRESVLESMSGVLVYWDLRSDEVVTVMAKGAIARPFLRCLDQEMLAVYVGEFRAPVTTQEIQEALEAHAQGRMAA